MFNEVVTQTNIIYDLMIVIAVVGLLAKVMNQIVLNSLLRASGNMPKSTHKLIKLVRSKYEHACMLHDRVENVDAFVEKYIGEYKGILFRIHTWRQLQIQSIWFVGILGAVGAITYYMEYGICDEVYQYSVMGVAGMILLFVVSQLSDEQYKLRRIQNYMIDYLDNICTIRHRRTRAAEKERIDVIQTDGTGARMAKADNVQSPQSAGNVVGMDGNIVQNSVGSSSGSPLGSQSGSASGNTAANAATAKQGLAIEIEGEPKKPKKETIARQVLKKSVKEKPEEQLDQLQEQKIRQILEEFLADM